MLAACGWDLFKEKLDLKVSGRMFSSVGGGEEPG